MYCFKDMTFCPYYESCKKGVSCYRALTSFIVAEVTKNKIPIAQFTEKPDCYTEKDNGCGDIN